MTPTERQRRDREMAAVAILIKRLQQYETELVRTDGKGSNTGDFYRLQADNAAIELWDDGNAMADRDAIMHDHRWDEDGNPECDILPMSKISPDLIARANGWRS